MGKVGSVSTYHRNIQNVAIEMYKVKLELAPIITAKVFSGSLGTHWNLRNHNDFRVPFTRTVYFGIEIISHLRPKIWDIVLTELKQNQADLKNQ